jgi:SAM-dependent methyltransferase
MMNEYKFFLKKYLRIWPPHMAVVRAFESVYTKKHIDLKSPSLDLGCGDGNYISAVFGKFDVGIDLDVEEIRRAQKTGAFSELHCCDAHNIPYPNGYFSTIVSNCVLEHIENPDGLISEIGRVLKENGEFVFTTWSPIFNSSLLINKKWYIKWKNKALRHVSVKSAQEWQEILQKHKLQVVLVERYVDRDRLKYLDFLELVSLIGFWKFRLINLYKVIAPYLPAFIIEKYSNRLAKTYWGRNNEQGCALMIKSVKIS